MARSVALVLVAAVVTAGTAEDVIAARVSAQTYAEAVCATAATYDPEAARSAVDEALQALRAQRTLESASALRQAMVVFLQYYRDMVNALLTTAREAGVPRGRDGARVAKAFIRYLQEAISAFEALVEQAKEIDATTPSRFATSFRSLGARAQTVLNDAKERAERETAFRNAPSSLRPVVGLFTSQAACVPSWD
jgi:hypothetical protein